MQDRYAGDVGDFSKFGLLKALTAGTQCLRLSLVWWRVPNEGHNDDGNYVDYPELRQCGPLLYDGLRAVVNRGERSVAALEGAQLLPKDTRYFAECLDFANCGPDRGARMQLRERWLARAVEAAKGADLVCLDPDNGLEGRSVTKTAAKGPKYVFLDELHRFLERGQSLVIYQHLARQGTASAQAQDRFGQLHRITPSGYDLFAMQWRRISGRFYYVLEAPAHRSVLRDRAEAMLKTCWHEHFKLIPPHG